MRLAILCVSAVLATSQRPVLEARFIGNMAFAITDGSVTLISDFPYQSGYSRYMTYLPEEIRSATPATLSLITHRHGDHWDRESFLKTTWTVAGPADVVAGIPANRIFTLGGTNSFGPIDIERLLTPHANVGHHSYIVTWHGKRLYFSGDTESTDTVVAARNLDIAFISPWIHRSLVTGKLAVDAKRIVIYHHEAGETIADCRDRCMVPRQGQTIPVH